MTSNSIIKMILEKNPDVIIISCAMVFNISKVKDLIHEIKIFGISAPIIVGGYPFNLDNHLWKNIGADAYSKDFEDAYLISEKFSSVGK